MVAAVLCPSTKHLSISPPKKRVPPAPAGRRIPYGERVKWQIREETVGEGVEIVRRLATPEAATDDE